MNPPDRVDSGDRCSAVLPSGLACSGPLLLDVAETAVGWMGASESPSATLRAIRAAVALYQATGGEPYLDQAVNWTAALERYHADAEAGGQRVDPRSAGGCVHAVVLESLQGLVDELRVERLVGGVRSFFVEHSDRVVV